MFRCLGHVEELDYVWAKFALVRESGFPGVCCHLTSVQRPSMPPKRRWTESRPASDGSEASCASVPPSRPRRLHQPRPPQPVPKSYFRLMPGARTLRRRSPLPTKRRWTESRPASDGSEASCASVSPNRPRRLHQPWPLQPVPKSYFRLMPGARTLRRRSPLPRPMAESTVALRMEPDTRAARSRSPLPRPDLTRNVAGTSSSTECGGFREMKEEEFHQGEWSWHDEMAMAIHLSEVAAEQADKASQSLQEQNALVVAIESPEQGDDPHEQGLPAENESSPTNKRKKSRTCSAGEHS